MNLRIAAIRSGTEPVRKLRVNTFARVLEQPLACPRCDTTYTVAVDWINPTTAGSPKPPAPHHPPLKNHHHGHGAGHRVTHFETEGVIVESITTP